MTLPRIIFQDTEYGVEEGETVLDALLRQNVDLPFSCRKGSCLTCVLRAIDGEISPAATKGLKPTLVEQGFFLPCLCEPKGLLTLASPDEAAIFGRAVVTDKKIVTPSVCRLRLQPATALYYRAGQFLNLRRYDGLARSYSLASVPHLDDGLELHVKRMPGGQMSNWIFDELDIGDGLDIQGPNGNCFYTPDRPEQSLMLIGTGTGLAPLVGIARDALHSGHSGPICLYHGSREADGLYLVDELSALAADHGNFHYVPCVSGNDVPAGIRSGRADVLALGDVTDLSAWRVFLCGHPAMVNATKKMAYLAGAAMADIMADPFDFQELRAKHREAPEELDVW